MPNTRTSKRHVGSALLLTVTVSIIWVGCNGSDTTDAAVDPCSFDHVQTIFNNSCAIGGSTCHGSTGVGGGGTPLHLDAVHSYNSIVGQASGELPSMPMVQPGDSTHSFLYHKVVGDMYSLPGCDADAGSCGVIMPMVAGVTLSQQDIDSIRCWIASGAPNSGQHGTFDGGM